jgi:ADP-heptose:LPS heptosyltransferase
VAANASIERGKGLLRALDRWIGVPLLLLMGLLRSKRSKPESFQSIGICVFAAIGDALLASALIADIKKANPGLKITIFATLANAPVFQLIRGWDELVLVPITKPLAAIRQLKAHPVDVLVDTSQWPRIGALICALSPAKWTIGFQTPGQARHFAYDCVVAHGSHIHELQNFRSLLAPLGIKTGLMPSMDEVAIAGARRLNLKEPYLVFHPWASGNHFEFREWPVHSWLELAKKALKAGYGVVFTGGPSDAARANALFHEIERAHPGAIADGMLLNLAGQADLVITAAYLQKAAAVISVNTGTMHLAALLEAPLVALHGPTNPDRWGPTYPGSGFKVIPIVIGPGRDQGGAYLNLGFEYPQNPQYLMNQISPQDVIEALRQFSINID